MASSTSRSTQAPEVAEPAPPAGAEPHEVALRTATRRAAEERRAVRRAPIGIDDRPDVTGTDYR
jgi:hypothetical protein